MGERGSGEARYTAFLSYSHEDAKAASSLHRRLESFRMPRRLVGSNGARGPVPERLWPIFRDREELPAASDLSETVRRALSQSGALIILCSSNAARSLWVAEEIRVFREIHPDRPILAAVVEGDPPDCFPPVLRAFGQDGTWHEPLATDLRPKADGERLGLLKLVAGISGVGLDDLVQRDASRRIRRVAMIGALAVLGMLVMAAMALLAWESSREADRQRIAAQARIDFMMDELRPRLRSVGRIDISDAVNRDALAYYDGQDVDGLSADSLERRARILQAIGEDEKARGHLTEALTAFREAHRITAEQLDRAPNDPDRIFSHAQSEYWLGSIAEQMGNYRAALSAYRRYRERAERMNALVPNNSRYLGELGYSESNLGIVSLNGFHRPEVARSNFQSSLRFFMLASRMDPANLTWREEAADAHAWIADTWYAQGNYRQARAERLTEQGLKRQLLSEHPDNRAYLYAVVIATRSLARIHMDLREFDRALPLLEESRRTMAGLLGLDADNLTWRNQATRIELNRAELFVRTGAAREAQSALAAATALLRGSDQRSSARSVEAQQLRERVDGLANEVRNMTPT